MNSIIIAALISWLVTLLIIRFNHLHADMTADADTGGVQKFHVQPVPRVGGIGLLLGLLAVGLWLRFISPPVGTPMLWLLLAACPAFLGGLAEDLTKRVSVLATGCWRPV
jgi:UDP-N-acetylmuramyl pentapeptide phosphotransferase/UDP-N-acetylglucosamine-1-phosphate transferase